jgi:hypothetical protein
VGKPNLPDQVLTAPDGLARLKLEGAAVEVCLITLSPVLVAELSWY